MDEDSTPLEAALQRRRDAYARMEKARADYLKAEQEYLEARNEVNALRAVKG